MHSQREVQVSHSHFSGADVVLDDGLEGLSRAIACTTGTENRSP
jgi:hypothetical protein